MRVARPVVWHIVCEGGNVALQQDGGRDYMERVVMGCYTVKRDFCFVVRTLQ